MAITKDKREKVRENYNGELPLLPFAPLLFQAPSIFFLPRTRKDQRFVSSVSWIG